MRFSTSSVGVGRLAQCNDPLDSLKKNKKLNGFGYPIRRIRILMWIWIRILIELFSSSEIRGVFCYLLLLFAPSIFIIRMASSSSDSSIKAQNSDNNRRQRITIQNKYGENLVGVLHETGSKDLVILCHGFRSSKEWKPLVTLAVALEKEGISAFRFDFAGNGESEGSFQYGNYRREVDDLRAVVLHFSSVKCVIRAIFGHSKGGNVVLLYASRYHDIHNIVNVSGRFNLEKGMEGRLGKNFVQRIKKDGFIDVKDKKGKVQYRVTEESLMDRLTTDMNPACLSIGKDCRVLTVHGSLDEIVSPKDALEFAKLISNHKLHLIEGADHDYSSHPTELASIVLDFIRTGLQESKDTPKYINSRF